MKLIGNYLSPFARRVAISLNELGIAHEMENVMVSKNPEAVSGHNPLIRIPTLILDDGEVLVESFAILDAIDEMAGPGKALVPASGADRRRILKITAIALGTMIRPSGLPTRSRFIRRRKCTSPGSTRTKIRPAAAWPI